MNHLSLQFARYTIVGLCATATQYILLISLVELVHIQAVVASSIGSIAGSLVSYFMNHRFTFKSAKRHREALWKFYSIASIGVTLNALFMYLGVEQLHMHYFTAQLLTTAIILFWNFAGNRYWTFKH